MAGNIYQIEKLSYPQIDKLDRQKAVLIIAISPLEEHGPHLPIGVDIFNASFFAEHVAKLILADHPDYDILMFPALPLGTQVYKRLGSFYIKPSTLYDIVYQTGRGAAIYGFANIFVLSAHGTPKQYVAIETACRRVSRKDKVRMVCLTGGLAVKFLNGQMYEAIGQKLNRQYSDEEKMLLKYDYHAGWWETSMMLLKYPELVDKSYTELKPYLKDPVTRKVITPDIPKLGFYGAPAKADSAFAEASIEVLNDYIKSLVNRSLAGENITREANTPFGRYLIFHPFFKRNLYLTIAAIAVVAALIAIAYLPH